MRRFESIERAARRKPAQLNTAATLTFLRVQAANHLERSARRPRRPVVPESTRAGGSASASPTVMPAMSKSWLITSIA